MRLPTDDPAARSLAHWSEAGRAGMDAFYTWATLDYTLLAGVLDWRALLGGRDRLTLLDVACGSGKFPAALLREGAVDGLGDTTIAYDLLDPSAFSLAEAAAVLAPPFAAGARFETTLEDLDPAAGPWDVVWATHALYALEPARAGDAAARLLAAIAPAGGIGFVAQGSREGHYIRVHEAHRADLGDAAGEPYLASEDIAGALRRAGAEPHTRRLRYEHVVAPGDEAVLEGYLQRCLFDDTLSLDAMHAAPVLGTYLADCRDAATGAYRFPHEVDCLLLAGEENPPWTAGS